MGPKNEEIAGDIRAIKESMITKSALDRIITEIRNEIRTEFTTLLAAKDDEISQLKDKIAVYDGAINSLKLAQNKSEQYSRRQSLRIHGVVQKKGEKAEDCLTQVKAIISETELDIPDVVIDRTHRVGKGTKKKPAAIIAKFTTWRPRTLLYKARQNVFDNLGYKVTLDLTRGNIELMNELRDFITEKNIETVDYIFCDVNCQPIIKKKDDTFLRFDTLEEGKRLLRLEDDDLEEEE